MFLRVQTNDRIINLDNALEIVVVTDVLDAQDKVSVITSNKKYWTGIYEVGKGNKVLEMIERAMMKGDNTFQMPADEEVEGD